MADSLREPLAANGEQHDDSTEDTNGVGSKENSSFWVITEFQEQIRLAVPLVFVMVVDYAVYVVTLMFVGHLGALELASAAVATSVAGVSGFSLVIGMACALETLCGQAFGARQYRLVGIYFQRGILVLNAICVPVAVIWVNMGSILKAIGQDPEISDYAGRYVVWMIPSLFAYATLQAMTKFLQTQSLVFPVACCSALGLALHIPICWLLVTKSGMGFIGAAIANNISSVLDVVFLLVYIKFGSACKDTLVGFSAEVFSDAGEFLALALPSTVMTCLEYWSFEALVLLSGLLPNPRLQTSAFSVCLTTLGVMFMIPYGLSTAASTRVSNELGAGRISAAKRVVWVATSMGLCEGILFSTIIFCLRNVWADAFTSDPEVAHLVASFMPILALLAVMDACQGVLSGITRGSGSQLFGAGSNLVAYYVVGLPLAITLAFYFHLNGIGLWIGMIAAVTVQAFSLGMLALFSSWQKQAQDAKDRNFKGQLPIARLD